MTVLIVVTAWVVLSVPLALAVAAFVARGCVPARSHPLHAVRSTPSARRQERDAA